MKFCFLILMFIASLALIIGFFVVRKNKNEFADVLSKLLLIAACNMILYCFAHLAMDTFFASLFFNLHFASTEWLMLWMYHYIVVYTGSKHVLKQKKCCLVVIAIVNTFLFLGNSFFHYLFEVTVSLFENNTTGVWEIQYKPLFYLHIVFAYYLTMCIVIRLIRKIHQSAYLYKKLYFPILLQICFVSGINIFRYYMHFKFDISLPFYAVTMLIMCYYSLYAKPKELIEDVMVKIVEDMQQCIFCFDLRGKCIYANKYALQVFAGEKDAIIEAAEQNFLAWKNKKAGILPDYEKGVFPTDFYGKKMQIAFEFQSIKDKKQEISGYFIKMEDYTSELEKLNREQYFATHDNLTGLYKREAFFKEASRIMKKNPDIKWYIICSDITNFKLINDFFGEEVGDKVLRNQATYLKTLCNDYCIAGRIISDRFVMLMPEKQFDAQILEREVGQMQFIDETINYQVRVVFGVYEVEDVDENVRIMCDKAYMAFATIEDDYHKHVVYYDSTMLDHMLYEKQILEDLNYSLEDNRFCLYFQPQVDAKGEIVGAEALVRWNHPTLGLIFPDEFVKIYEKTGMIYKLDRYIWEEAAKKLGIWKKMGITDMSISVNISARDFYYADLANVFIQLVNKYQIEPKNLHLEITESVAFSDDSIYAGILQKLQEFGFVLEIDDFGSGYASLYRVQNLCADMLKIDMMFLSKTANLEKSEKIICSVIQMAKKLGMEVITEGVEDRKQFDRLVAMGGDYFQGYYFSHPVTAEEFETKFLKMS